MRITQNMIFNTVTSNLSLATRKLLESQEIMSTQKQINRPSDDPSGSGRILTIRKMLDQNDQFQRNIDSVQSENQLHDSTIQQIVDILTRAKELTLSQAGDATTNETSREATTVEIINLREQILELSNTKGVSGYLFSGFQINTEPFSDIITTITPNPANTGGAIAEAEVSDKINVNYHDYQITFTTDTTYDVVDTTTGETIVSGQSYTSGSTIYFDGMNLTITDDTATPLTGDIFNLSMTEAGTAYNGDNKEKEIEISQDTYIKQNITGDRLFKGVGVPDGVDMFSVFNDVIEAIRAGDTAAINVALEDFDKSAAQVQGFQSLVGARTNILDNTLSRLDDYNINLQTLLSGTEDADLAEAITELSKKETAYQASMGSAQKLISESLFDLLR